MSTNTHGGARQNAGRPSIYKEPTVTISMRVPVSMVDEIKKAVKKLINKKQSR